MEFIPGKIGIKITNTTSMAKCVQILRKYTSASMSEIISTIKSTLGGLSPLEYRRRIGVGV